MAWMHPDAIEERRQRWTRPDAERWLKPNPEHWLSPEELRLEYPELYERKYGSLLQRKPPSGRNAPGAEIGRYPFDDPEVRWLLAEIKLDLLRLQYWRKANFDPNQPRVSAGNADGGQWSTEGSGATAVDQGLVPEGEHDQPTESWDSTPELNDGLQPTIEFVAARDRAAGHHYVPQGVFKKYDFPEDTRRVFDSARTGPIPDLLRTILINSIGLTMTLLKTFLNATWNKTKLVPNT